MPPLLHAPPPLLHAPPPLFHAPPPLLHAPPPLLHAPPPFVRIIMFQPFIIILLSPPTIPVNWSFCECGFVF